MLARFFLVDVFTSRAFRGNQLAVFPEADDLSSTAMQALAREFNFAETTFVVPPTNRACAARVRIFTPRAELPFAGHPTIGTTAVLARLGRLNRSSDHGEAMLEEGVGPVRVEARAGEEAGFARFTLEPRLEVPGGVPTPVELARVLSVDVAAIRESVFAGVGLPFCMVRLSSSDAVDRAELDRAAWAETFAQAWAKNLFLFAGDTAPGGRLYARMFAPALGVGEDPATGSACAALAALLARDLAEPDGSYAWRIEQGVKMGRPSSIEAGAVRRGGAVVAVSVGGYSVIVGEGRIDIA